MKINYLEVMQREIEIEQIYWQGLCNSDNLEDDVKRIINNYLKSLEIVMYEILVKKMFTEGEHFE